MSKGWGPFFFRVSFATLPLTTERARMRRGTAAPAGSRHYLRARVLECVQARRLSSRCAMRHLSPAPVHAAARDRAEAARSSRQARALGEHVRAPVVTHRGRPRRPLETQSPGARDRSLPHAVRRKSAVGRSKSCAGRRCRAGRIARTVRSASLARAEAAAAARSRRHERHLRVAATAGAAPRAAQWARPSAALR